MKIIAVLNSILSSVIARLTKSAEACLAGRQAISNGLISRLNKLFLRLDRLISRGLIYIINLAQTASTWDINTHLVGGDRRMGKLGLGIGCRVGFSAFCGVPLQRENLPYSGRARYGVEAYSHCEPLCFLAKARMGAKQSLFRLLYSTRNAHSNLVKLNLVRLTRLDNANPTNLKNKTNQKNNFSKNNFNKNLFERFEISKNNLTKNFFETAKNILNKNFYEKFQSLKNIFYVNFSKSFQNFFAQKDFVENIFTENISMKNISEKVYRTLSLRATARRSRSRREAISKNRLLRPFRGLAMTVGMDRYFFHNIRDCLPCRQAGFGHLASLGVLAMTRGKGSIGADAMEYQKYCLGLYLQNTQLIDNKYDIYGIYNINNVSRCQMYTQKAPDPFFEAFEKLNMKKVNFAYCNILII